MDRSNPTIDIASPSHFELNDISLPAGLDLRMAYAEDSVFMERLFASTREYLYSMDIPRQYIDTLVKQQYRLQQAYYAIQFPNARAFIVSLSGEAIGKIILDISETALHIVDFALEPGGRGRGYGTSIVNAVQAAAQQSQTPIKLSVDRQNLQAKNLYLRLGFKTVVTSETHEAMVWSPCAVLHEQDDRVFNKKQKSGSPLHLEVCRT